MTNTELEHINRILLNKVKENEKVNIFDFKKVNITELTKIESGSRDRFRELIRIRDNHTCQWCGLKWKKGKRRLDIHHINGEPKDTRSVGGNPLEMITLCHHCHFIIDGHKMGKAAKQKTPYK